MVVRLVNGQTHYTHKIEIASDQRIKFTDLLGEKKSISISYVDMIATNASDLNAKPAGSDNKATKQLALANHSIY